MGEVDGGLGDDFGLLVELGAEEDEGVELRDGLGGGEGDVDLEPGESGGRRGGAGLLLFIFGETRKLVYAYRYTPQNTKHTPEAVCDAVQVVIRLPRPDSAHPQRVAVQGVELRHGGVEEAVALLGPARLDYQLVFKHVRGLLPIGVRLEPEVGRVGEEEGQADEDPHRDEEKEVRTGHVGRVVAPADGLLEQLDGGHGDQGGGEEVAAACCKVATWLGARTEGRFERGLSLR